MKCKRREVVAVNDSDMTAEWAGDNVTVQEITAGRPRRVTSVIQRTMTSLQCHTAEHTVIGPAIHADQSPTAMIWWSMQMTPILSSQKRFASRKDDLKRSADYNHALQSNQIKSCFTPEVDIVPKTNNHHHCLEFNALAASKFLALLSAITSQWLDMFLLRWTSMQEHCVVCWFAESMVDQSRFRLC